VKCKVVVLALLLAGCNSGYIRQARIEAPRPPLPELPFDVIKVTGKATTEDRQIIELALILMRREVWASVREIQIRSDYEHFSQDGDTVRIVRAHRCNSGKRKICIVAGNKITAPLVWHETAHVYHYNLSDYHRAYNFYRSWMEIAGNVYHDRSAEPESEGVLTYYSRRSFNEDIAEWVEECLAYLYAAGESPILKIKDRKTDKRYRKKLTLLYEHSFFTEEQYKKLKPLFE